ncbi:MAG: Response regulator of zinc sigma-54-dependent two-component system [Myxococcaceae bacterium]|nr:Response regulator of zinc sigma-54-dependent two-component system [Myxococcaceae bacterium]
MHSRLVALFTLAFVLYVLASLGAAGVALDFGVLALGLVAIASALGPVLLRRGGAAEPSPSDPGPELVSGLASAQAVGLAAFLSTATHGMSSEILTALSLPAVSIAVLRLSLRVPDAPPRLRQKLPIAVAAVVLAGSGALAGVIAAWPPIWLGGRALIAPQRWALLPLLAAALCCLAALALRLLRRRLGSDARALAANLWASLGIGSAVVCFASFALLRQLGFLAEARVLLSLSAALLLLGHAWSIAPARAVVASAWARELFAALLAFAFALAALWYPGRALLQLAAGPIWLSVPFVLLFLIGLQLCRRLATRVLAPQGGALLRAIAEARDGALGASDFGEFAARVLKPLRRAGALPEASPRFVSFDPPRVAQLDAAGFARVTEQRLPTAITTRLSQRPGEPLVRSELSSLLPRRPELVGVVKAMDELDALCVIPLVALGELEGALLIARGARREHVTLEELLELARLAGHLAPISAGYLALERARLRGDAVAKERSELLLSTERLHNELSEQRAQSTAVRAGLGLPLPERDPVQYSAVMRGLSEQLVRAAPHEVPLLLWGETGLSLSPVAQSIHRASGRAGEPFVIVDAAELNADNAAARLFGMGARDQEKPGLLELIGAGTLLLLDVCALPRAQQLALAELFEERQVRPVRSAGSVPFRGRVVATARRPLGELLEADALAPELARWFSATTYRVPSLRERADDLESLLLLALDRAARVLGKTAKGVEAEALKALLEYDWPGNDVELMSIVERAVAQAQGERIAFADLPPLAAFATFRSSGSFAEQEREILRRALRNAHGDRTLAARALGLKRGIFVEKLHRLSVEDPTNAEN